ncbi:metal-sensing transcriptional repressor [Streptomyces sp. NPDC020719]
MARTVDEEATAAVLNRLRRAQGQLAGVIAMTEAELERLFLALA